MRRGVSYVKRDLALNLVRKLLLLPDDYRVVDLWTCKNDLAVVIESDKLRDIPESEVQPRLYIIHRVEDGKAAFECVAEYVTEYDAETEQE